ncbi:MFS transporter [Ferrimonas pelagia]|uniref:MFS transporter n=1 Tax=Ferrimonas pelagia TaxID=1177826 RepID=A0ABP9FF95_9GAMM
MTATVSAADSRPSESVTEKVSWLSFIILVAAQLVTIIDQATLQVSTDAMIAQLGADLPKVQFANATYAMIAAGGMLIGGFSGLLIGWHRQLQIGLVTLLSAFVLMALAPNMTVLIGVRVLVALGACLLIPSVLAHVAGLYHGAQRATAFAMLGAALGLTGVLIPVAAGMLIDIFGFSATYMVVAGYTALVLVASFKIAEMPKSEAAAKFDSIGALLGCGGMVLLIVGLLQAANWGVFKPLTDFAIFGLSPSLVLVCSGILLLAALLRWEPRFEAKYGSALLPKAFTSNPQVMKGFYVLALSAGALSGVMFVFIAYAQLVAGFSAMTTGLSIMIMAVTMVIASVLTPAKLGPMSIRKVIGACYLLLAMAAIALYFGMQVDGYNSLAFIALVLIGASCGPMVALAPVIVTSALAARDAQQSGGLQATMKNIGVGIFLAVLGTIMNLSITGEMQQRTEGHPQLSVSVEQALQTTASMPFASDEQLVDQWQAVVQTEDEMQVLVALNAEARLRSGRNTIMGFFILVLLGFPMLRMLPDRSLNPPEKA